MCGIVSALAFGNLPEKTEATRQEVMRLFTTELLLATEPRGKDATGAVILFEDGNFFGMKRGEKVSDFLAKFGTNKNCYGGLLKVWKNTKVPVKTFIGHCRAGTSGSNIDNKNNHPIKVGNIVGVHNGVIRNDEEIFKNLGCERDAKVDSEAIFRLAAYYTNDGKEPFTMHTIEEIVHRLEGPFSVVMFNGDNPYQIPVFCDGRPIEFIFIRELGLLFIISDKTFWTTAHYTYERIVNYYKKQGVASLPSLLGMDIEKSSLPGDNAVIFDLTQKVTKQTKLKDVGEWGKLAPTNRIWKTSCVRTYTSYNKYVSGGGKPAVAITKEPTSVVSTFNNGKRLVFDKIKNKYVIEMGDKELNPEETAKLPITNTKNTVQTSTNSVEIEDLTSYNDKNDSSNKIKAADVTEEKAVEIVVDMTQDPPAIIEAAEDNYKQLPTKQRGFDNKDAMLDAIGIKNVDIAERLGIDYLGNRVFHFAWVKGFVAGCKYASRLFKNDVDKIAKIEKKTKRREEHITNLKTIVLLLSKIFNKNNSKEITKTNLKQDIKIDIESTKQIFNSWEKNDFGNVVKIIEKTFNVVEAPGNESTTNTSSV